MSEAFKNAQPPSPLPGTSIPLHAIKPLEREIQERKILTRATESPLWFLAETERNVFLWKAGHSLAQEQEFDFWVDIAALIGRRIAQMGRDETGLCERPADAGHNDAFYLRELLDLAGESLTELHARHWTARLSRPPRTLVLLPVGNLRI